MAKKQFEKHVVQRTQDVELLLKAAQTIASKLELKPLLRTILEQLKAIVDYSGAAIYSIQHDQLILLDHQQPFLSAQVEQLVLLFEQNSIYKQVLQQREAVIVDDLHTYPLFVYTYKEGQGKQVDTLWKKLRSWMAVPLLIDDHVIGMLSLNHHRPNFYTPQHASLAIALANQAAIALKNAQRYEQAQAQAVFQERQRLARELHDSISQQFYGISLNAQSAREALETDPAEALASLEQVIQHTHAGFAEMRALLCELRPEFLQTEGLITALTREVAVLRTSHQLNVEISLATEPNITLESKYAIYRIAQEALHNVVKHARACNVMLRFAVEEEQLVLEVHDNGRGFDPSGTFPGHLGLLSMCERVNELGGILTVTSAPGQGTSLYVRIPQTAAEVPPIDNRKSENIFSLRSELKHWQNEG